MQKLYQKYIDILKNIVTQKKNNVSLEPKETEHIFSLASKHCIIPLLLPYFKQTTLYPIALQQTKAMYLNYYQMDAFMQKTIQLLTSNDITVFVMKGLSLAQFYPYPESRKMGDLDLYIPNQEEFKKAKQILSKNNYLETTDMGDHHVGFFYTAKNKKRFELELHYRVIGKYAYEPCNKMIDTIFSSVNERKQTINGYTYTVFCETETVFYMIHHMLRHYLYSGFGIRLFLDFTFYIQKNKTKINFGQIHSWCKKSHIFNFYQTVISCCKNYLGLDVEIDKAIQLSKEECQYFMIQIIEQHDMGTNTPQALIGRGSYKKINLISYFKEGHAEMKVRFPKAGKIILLWPVLWLITLIRFIYNTYTLRNTSITQTLKNFKKINEATQKIAIFENSKE